MTFYRFWWWLAYGLAVFLFRLRVEGRDNVPRSGAVVVASNHCSLPDPVIIGVAAGRELDHAEGSSTLRRHDQGHEKCV